MQGNLKPEYRDYPTTARWAGSMKASDAALVQAAQGGDKAAFAVLFTRHLPVLRALCLRALGDPGPAEDAVQEAALQALLGIDRLRQPDRFGPWLAGIGLNVCRRWLRERSRAAWSWDALSGGSAGSVLPDPDGEVEQRIEASELRNEVRRAIASLPRGQREAVTLFYLAGLTHAEIAALLGIETGAVKTRLHKARATLARQLAETREEEPMQEKLDRRKLAKAAGALTATAALAHEGLAAAASPATAPDVDGFVTMGVVDVRRQDKGLDRPPAYVVLLAETGGARRLPIWVGEPEATAIALHLEGIETPRPMTVAFAAALLAATGSELREVRIDRLAETVFYATAILAGPGGEQRVDARPSDALNLALIAGAPVRAATGVLDAVAAHPEYAGHEQGDGPGEIAARVQATWAKAAP